MDKLKDFTRMFKKYHFWVLSVVILAVALGTWYMATADLVQETKANVSKRQQDKSALETIAREVNHPNTNYHERMEERIEEIRQSVNDAWKAKFEKQEGVFPWPEGLKKDFINAVKGLRPIEANVPFDPTGQQPELLSVPLRERYANFIKQELPKLAEIVSAKWNPSTETTGGTGGAGNFNFGFGGRREETPARDEETEAEALVMWDSQNQTDIQQRRFDWSDQPGKRPTTLQLLYAQEDYWVLKALLEIISRTNGGVSQRYKLAIPEIRSINIGADAGEVVRAEPVAGNDGGGGETTSSPAPPPSEYENFRSGPMGGTTGTAAPLEDPANGRYVDLSYQKLSGDQLRKAAQSENPAEAALAVAKRMPIRMELLMDQRKIDKLLVECGNSPLTVEVRQIRLNPSSSGSVRPPQPSAVGGQLNEGPGNYVTDTDTRPYDVPVEVYGIISIFNPVNRKVLGFDDATEEGATPGSTPGAGGTPARGGPTEPAAPATPTPAGGAEDAVGAPAGAGGP